MSIGWEREIARDSPGAAEGSHLAAALGALRAAGFVLDGFDPGGRLLRQRLPADGLEIMLLKDWDLPLYVERGVADCGVVGSDVLDEVDGDLLIPLRLRDGRCRLSLIGPPGGQPLPGAQVRLATKYVETARRYVAEQAWGASIVPLSGSLELAPLLGLADVALDIVQTGRTLREHGLVELAVVREVLPCLVANRAAYQALRDEIHRLAARLEKAEVAA